MSDRTLQNDWKKLKEIYIDKICWFTDAVRISLILHYGRSKDFYHTYKVTFYHINLLFKVLRDH